MGLVEIIIALLVLVAGSVVFFKRSPTSSASGPASKQTNGFNGVNGVNGAHTESDPRDWVSPLATSNRKLVCLYGSQTGTAEDYATRLAKEAKSRFGQPAFVYDIEDVDFENMDKVPEDVLVIFVMATYGEGEPTDSATEFYEFLVTSEEPSFSEGESSTLPNLKYTVFALGNTTYEHYCKVGIDVDEKLEKLEGTRIHPCGKGDDDKNIEEDYISWKDAMWESVAEKMGWEEGGGADSPDFTVEEIPVGQLPEETIFRGELSQRALDQKRGIFDMKNPYPAPVSTYELFESGDRNGVHINFNVAGSGIRYTTGDHVGVWPVNAECDVERFLAVLGLQDKRDTIISVTSLDPTFAKVHFPNPTTYTALFRHYLDISGLASRQTIAQFAKFAPTPESSEFLSRVGNDKEAYQEEVLNRSLRIAEVLAFSTGISPTADPFTTKFTKFNIPFDRIISTIQRLQPRYYSISSAPRYAPDTVSATVVVTTWEDKPDNRTMYGVGSNYLFNVKTIMNPQPRDARCADAPKYDLVGPRQKYQKESVIHVPIHIRRSNFRLPANVKVPIIMIGPGTGVAPFRGFIQEKVVLARKTKAKPDTLDTWGDLHLYYGCRQANEDFLYKDEWDEYAKELDGKLHVHTAFSRVPGKPKEHVQALIQRDAELIGSLLVKQKGHLYICGDAKYMAKAVEQLIEDIVTKELGDRAKAIKEIKMMKDRARFLLDVWS